MGSRNIREPIDHESLPKNFQEVIEFTNIVTKLVWEVQTGMEDDTDLVVWAFQSAGSASLIMNQEARRKMGTANQIWEDDEDGQHR